MFRSLRPNSALYVLKKDSMTFDIGSVVSVSNPVPKYQMQPSFGPNQEMVVDIIARVGDQDLTYQKIPADLDIADFGNNSIVLTDNRDAMNNEILNIKKKNIDEINNIDYRKNVVQKCDEILSRLNPEFAEKQAQQKDIAELRLQIAEMSKSFASLLEQNKQILGQVKASRNNKGE